MLPQSWTSRFYLMADEGGGGSSGGSSSGDSGGGTAVADAPATSDYHHPDSAYKPGRGDRTDDFIKTLKEGADKLNGKAPNGAAAVPQDAAAAAQQQGQAANGFTDQHYQYAQNLGMTREQVAAFGGPQQFEAFLNHVDQNNRRHIEQHAQQLAQQYVRQFQQQQPQLPQYNPGAQNAQNQQQQPAPGGFQPFALPTLSGGDSYDPGIVAMTDHFNKVIGQLYQQFGGMTPQIQQMQQMAQQFEQFRQAKHQESMTQLRNTIDTALPKIDKELFGEGQHAAVSAHQQAMRTQLLQAAAKIEAGYKQSGEALPPTQQLLEAAYRWQFGDRIAQQTAAGIAEKSKSNRGLALAVPGMSRREEASSPEDRAARAMKEKMAEFDRGAA